MNGGSFLCTAVRNGGADALAPFVALEDVHHLNDQRGWETFALRVQSQRDQLRELLDERRGAGAAVVAYGAAAKTMVLLGYCGVTRESVPMIGDVSERKQGLVCAGSGIPVVSPAALVAAAPDSVLIGPWNLADEIMASLRALGHRGSFILPIPVPQEVHRTSDHRRA
jgi:hypothetical protein